MPDYVQYVQVLKECSLDYSYSSFLCCKEIHSTSLTQQHLVMWVAGLSKSAWNVCEFWCLFSWPCRSVWFPSVPSWGPSWDVITGSSSLVWAAALTILCSSLIVHVWWAPWWSSVLMWKSRLWKSARSWCLGGSNTAETELLENLLFCRPLLHSQYHGLRSRACPFTQWSVIPASEWAMGDFNYLPSHLFPC